MKIDVILLHDQNLLKNLLYNTFVPHPMIKHQYLIQDQMTTHIDGVVEVHLVLTIRKTTILNIDKDLQLELVIIMIEMPILHSTLDHVMIIIKEILAHIVHHIDHLIDHPTDVIHVPNINLDLTLEKKTSRNILLHTEPLQGLEISDIQDLAHVLIQEIKSIIFNHNLLLTQSILKYPCIT